MSVIARDVGLMNVNPRELKQDSLRTFILCTFIDYKKVA